MTNYLDGFLEYLADQRRLSPRSIEAYGYAVRSYLVYLRDRDLSPERADQATVRGYLKRREREGLGPGGVHQEIFSLRHFYKFLRKGDPTAGMSLPRLRPKLPEPLSREEMERLLGCVQPRLLPVVVCALMTGMRRSEILGMEWQNVDRKRGIIYVLKTKSAKPREIPIAGKLARVLTDLGPKDAGRVFDIPVITIRRHFLKALRAAGIHSFRFHDLRHTFASWFMMKGGNIYTLQKLLGHSSVVMTMRYAHLSQGHLASEMAVFESAIPVPPSVPHVDSGAPLPLSATQKVPD